MMPPCNRPQGVEFEIQLAAVTRGFAACQISVSHDKCKVSGEEKLEVRVEALERNRRTVKPLSHSFRYFLQDEQDTVTFNLVVLRLHYVLLYCRIITRSNDLEDFCGLAPISALACILFMCDIQVVARHTTVSHGESASSTAAKRPNADMELLGRWSLLSPDTIAARQHLFFECNICLRKAMDNSWLWLYRRGCLRPPQEVKLSCTGL
jgi:hypothetical protein